jgi:hypothetical protein
LYSGPSHAIVHSVSVQTRLPCAAHFFCAAEKSFITSGFTPFLFGYSYLSMQYRFFTLSPTHFVGSTNSWQMVFLFASAKWLFLHFTSRSVQ